MIEKVFVRAVENGTNNAVKTQQESAKKTQYLLFIRFKNPFLTVPAHSKAFLNPHLRFILSPTNQYRIYLLSQQYSPIHLKILIYLHSAGNHQTKLKIL